MSLSAIAEYEEMYMAFNNKILALTFMLLCAGPSWAGSAAQKTLRDLTTEKPGSPYHWVGEEMEGGAGFERVLSGIPASTVADDTLKQDVLKAIGNLEQKFGGSQLPTLVEVRQWEKDEGGYREVWVISRAGENIAYTVFLKSSSQSGTDLDVKGPWD